MPQYLSQAKYRAKNRIACNARSQAWKMRRREYYAKKRAEAFKKYYKENSEKVKGRAYAYRSRPDIKKRILLKKKERYWNDPAERERINKRNRARKRMIAFLRLSRVVALLEETIPMSATALT